MSVTSGRRPVRPVDGLAGRSPRVRPAPAEEPPLIRGVATAPERSVVAAPLVGIVVRQKDRPPKPAREWVMFTLIVGYPVWRLLGATLFIVPLLAVPMALELFRRRRLKYPAGTWLWVLLLAVGLFSVFMINKTAPGAIPPTPGLGRYLAYAQRMADYVTALIILLYVGNLSERELPTRRVAKMLAALFVMVTFGGLISLFVPHITLRTPVSHLLPHSLASNAFVVHLVSVEFAQYQDALAEVTGARPAFPFQYTNTWGQCLALLLPWFIIATMRGPKTLFQRIWPIGVLLIAMIPTVYSLNRGMWIGIGIGMMYLVIRLALKGRTLPAVIVLATAGVVAAIILTTPLSTVIVGRIDNPNSNEGRSNINSATYTAAKSSPIIGYGGQDSIAGSGRGIAGGKTANCAQCGNRDMGSDGQMWLLLITEGFLGLLLYVAFFARFFWRYRHDTTWIGLAGGATVLMAMWFMVVYTALELPLMIMMITLGLWWRNERSREFV